MLVFVALTQSAKDLLYPKLSELVIGAIAFFVLFAFMYKWVVPMVNKALEARQAKIQGDLEKAEATRHEAEQQLSDYREQLSGAREESNRIIEESRRTAEAMRQEMAKRAEEESAAIVARAQDEIRVERDRVFQELKAQVGELSLELAGRMVGESLDRDRQLRLVDEYINELGRLTPASNGNGRGDGSDGREA